MFARPLAVLTAASGLALALGALPVQSPAPSPAPSPTASPSPEASPRPRKPPKAHSTSGTIVGYDAKQWTLTVKTSKGQPAFAVDEALVWVGAKSVDASELNRPGAKVTVKYYEDSGRKVARSVRIAPASTEPK